MATTYPGNIKQAYGPYGSGAVAPALPTVSVDAQHVATLSNLPAGTSATDYDYQFRPGPAVSGQRVADISQTLAAGESATDYEYQTR